MRMVFEIGKQSTQPVHLIAPSTRSKVHLAADSNGNELRSYEVNITQF